MTPKEALKRIEQHIEVHSKKEPFAHYINEALMIAVNALEKQIPKEPKIVKVHDISNYKYGDCECGEHICDDEKYCSNCGQAIDWGDTE